MFELSKKRLHKENIEQETLCMSKWSNQKILCKSQPKNLAKTPQKPYATQNRQ